MVPKCSQYSITCTCGSRGQFCGLYVAEAGKVLYRAAMYHAESLGQSGLGRKFLSCLAKIGECAKHQHHGHRWFLLEVYVCVCVHCLEAPAVSGTRLVEGVVDLVFQMCVKKMR